MRRVLVIGAGAAGMMAAISAAEHGAQVTLLEQNEKTGKKIYITGKGRCNLTNTCDREAFFENVVSNAKFLYSAFYGMDNQAVITFFEQAGCRLKTERGDRVFPASDHSSDVIAALNRRLGRADVKVRLNTRVMELLTDVSEKLIQADGGIGQAVAGPRRVRGVRLQDGSCLEADAVILATGGRTYEATGSTGDGYRWAQQLGHSISQTKPALVPLNVQEDWCKALQGLSLKNVSVLLTTSEKKKIYEGFGEMLFTHFGVSGPLILSASSYYIQKQNGKPVTLEIDLKPALTREQLDKRILRDFEKSKNRFLKNALDDLLPSKLIPVIIRLSGIPPERPVNEITRQQREALLGCLKRLSMTITGTRGFEEAIITQGGVQVREVEPGTMESKLVRELYFAGEMLDVDALTGGFNLQIAWSTGYLAGKSAATE